MDLELNKIEFNAALENLASQIDQMCRLHGLQARLMRNYFNELCKTGFSEEQALKIVINNPWGSNAGPE